VDLEEVGPGGNATIARWSGDWQRKIMFAAQPTMDSTVVLKAYVNRVDSDEFRGYLKKGIALHKDSSLRRKNLFATKVLEGLFANGGWDFRRTTSTDFEIRKLLLRELQRRIAPFSSKPHPGMILAEVDSAYGLSWLKFGEKAKANLLWKDILENENKYGADLLAKIDVTEGLVYSRGLDGSGLWVGGPKGVQSSDEAHDQEAYPFGFGQIDYLRRDIAEQLSTETTIFGSNVLPDSVGVFGVDPFDKMMLISGIKPKLPRAIIYSVDLDARYFHSKDLPITKNLIVASHFGLSLRPELQKSLPPFRDCYQTANFFATLCVINEMDQNAFDPKFNFCSYELHPRIFEIGNSGAIDITDGPKLNTKNSPHPIREFVDFSLWKFLSFVLAVLISLAFMDSYILDYRIRDWLVSMNSYSRAKWWFSVYFLVIAAIWVFANYSSRNGGEPFFWTAGVSVWPTQFIRMFGIGLASVYILRMKKKFRKRRDLLDKQLFSVENAPWPAETMERTPLLRAWKRMKDAHSSGVENKESRAATWVVLVIYTLTTAALGWGGNPTRGQGVVVIDWFTSLLGISFFSFLFCKSLRYLRSLATLVKALDSEELQAKDWSKDDFEAKEMLIYRRHEITLIERVGNRIYGFIYFPAAVLLVFGLARSTYFDAWPWPTSLIVALPVVFLALLIAGAFLRRHATFFRMSRVQELQRLERGFRYPAGNQKKQLASAEECAALREELVSFNRGVFSSLLNDPILRAMLVPLSGFGALAMLEEGITFL
jgi:hypothetical protein